ncbi:hypothetical protein B1218_19420 [Pseudomonas ogarae]|nr:hypothetical protein B1218_19420 [Pseudomonas ogarae]
MKHVRNHTKSQAALLRSADGVAAPVKNSPCCAAAGIIAPSSPNTEVLIPHEKLRGAAHADATLNAQERPLAQPAVGYTSTGSSLTYGKPSRIECQEVA